jgi:hypothetical protein
MCFFRICATLVEQLRDPCSLPKAPLTQRLHAAAFLVQTPSPQPYGRMSGQWLWHRKASARQHTAQLQQHLSCNRTLLNSNCTATASACRCSLASQQLCFVSRTSEWTNWVLSRLVASLHATGVHLADKVSFAMAFCVWSCCYKTRYQSYAGSRVHICTRLYNS